MKMLRKAETMDGENRKRKKLKTRARYDDDEWCGWKSGLVRGALA